MPSQPLYSIADAQQMGFLEASPTSNLVIAQAVRDADILGQIQTSFRHFVDSGQIWALILGFMLGFWFSGLRRG